MIISERVAKAGYEQFYEMAKKRMETVEAEVKARVEAEVAKEKEDLNRIIETSSVVVEKEVPDEVPAENVENPQE